MKGKTYFDEKLRRYSDFVPESLGSLKMRLHWMMDRRFSVDKVAAYKWLYKITGKNHVADLDREKLKKAMRSI